MKKITLALLLALCMALPSKSFSQDNQDKIKDRINKLYDIINTGDFSQISQIFDVGFVEHSLYPGQKPGLDGFVETIKSFRVAFPDMKFTISDIIITNDKAAVLGAMTGTNSGEFMGTPATNKKVNIMGIDWILFNKDGKCTDHWGYEDDMLMMQQLGLSK